MEILKSGDKILVSHRRLYPQDESRFFLGIVDAYDNGVARVTGRSWSRDALHGSIHGKDDLRTRVLSLASGALMVYLLPSALDLDRLVLELDGDRRLILTNGDTFTMDLTDRVH